MNWFTTCKTTSWKLFHKLFSKEQESPFLICVSQERKPFASCLPKVRNRFPQAIFQRNKRFLFPIIQQRLSSYSREVGKSILILHITRNKSIFTSMFFLRAKSICIICFGKKRSDLLNRGILQMTSKLGNRFSSLFLEVRNRF